MNEKFEKIFIMNEIRKEIKMLDHPQDYFWMSRAMVFFDGYYKLVLESEEINTFMMLNGFALNNLLKLLPLGKSYSLFFYLEELPGVELNLVKNLKDKQECYIKFCDFCKENNTIQGDVIFKKNEDIYFLAELNGFNMEMIRNIYCLSEDYEVEDFFPDKAFCQHGYITMQISEAINKVREKIKKNAYHSTVSKRTKDWVFKDIPKFCNENNIDFRNPTEDELQLIDLNFF